MKSRVGASYNAGEYTREEMEKQREYAGGKRERKGGRVVTVRKGNDKELADENEGGRVREASKRRMTTHGWRLGE